MHHRAIFDLFLSLLRALRSAFRSRANLALENFALRLVGSARRECLDHVIVLGEQHVRGILKSCFAYYHHSRTHLSLGKDAPDAREACPPSMGEIAESPEVGGLHHRYERLAA